MSLPELLIEVDSWTHFSQHCVHAADAATLRPALLPHFYASVLAHACNFGLEQMASLTDLAYDHLAWCTTWHWREDTLKAADRAGQLSPSPPAQPILGEWYPLVFGWTTVSRVW